MRNMTFKDAWNHAVKYGMILGITNKPQYGKDSVFMYFTGYMRDSKNKEVG